MLSRSILLRAAVRRYSTAPPTASPPLLLKLREDLKAAMRAKDRQRLDVVKSLLAEITNASKTSAPADTDIAILQIINKTKTKAQDSIREAQKAGRGDIVEKEKVGITFLDEYASKVNSMSPEQIRAVVEKVVASMGKDDKGNPPGMGQVLKNVMPELEGEPVLRADVAKTVKQYLREVRD